MNLVSPSQIRAFLSEKGIHPNRSLGQNFLIDGNILNIIVNAARPCAGDSILEVGPGLGVLTERLAVSGAKVFAVEKDPVLFECLKEILPSSSMLNIRCGDMLDIGVGGYLESGVNKVVSNLPYSCGTRILLELVCDAKPPELIVVTVQLEVAQRLIAKPGCSDYGMLSVWAQLIYDIELIRTIKPTCFLPRPAVDSGIVRMTRRAKVLGSMETQEMFCALTKQAFTHRRKQLAPVLSRIPAGNGISTEDARALLEKIEIDVKARPENLSVEQWCSLLERL